MRVLMLASCYPTETEPYLCLFLQELTEQLEKIIPEHYVLSLHGYSKLNLIKRVLEIKSFIKKNRIDIIHAQFGYSAGFYASLIKRNRPLIITIHRFELFRKKTRLLLKFALKKAKLVIAVSEYVKKELLKINSKLENKIVVLPNGVNTQKFTQKEIKKVRSDDTIAIGTLAHHTKRKGIDLLLQAFHELERNHDNLELHIAGEGPETAALKDLAKNLSIKRVIFHGSITEDQKIDFYHSLDIFVLSSYSEGHPVALLESMCSGACPIVSNIPSIEDTVFDGINGRIFNQGDYKHLALVLDETIRNIDKLNSFKIESRSIVLKNFDLYKRAEKLKTLYETLLK